MSESEKKNYENYRVVIKSSLKVFRVHVTIRNKSNENVKQKKKKKILVNNELSGPVLTLTFNLKKLF